ncbi:MAG: DUF4352 domain-containing protein [archaeon]
MADKNYAFSINDVLRGEEANNIILSENMYNDEPPSGKEYLMVNVQVEYREGDGKTSISSSDVSIFASGEEVEENYAVLPNEYEEFSVTGEVMPGATKNGWMTYIVPSDKNIIVEYQPNMFIDKAGYIEIPNS